MEAVSEKEKEKPENNKEATTKNNKEATAEKSKEAKNEKKGSSENAPLVVETGFVIRVVYNKPGSNWGIVRVRFKDGIRWAKGELLPVCVGALYQLGGSWEDDERWGCGLRVRFMREIIPSDQQQLFRYLVGLKLPKLTPTLCHKVSEKWGLQSLKIIEEEPQKLEEFGLSPESCQRIQQSWTRRLPSRSLLATPELWGLNHQQARSLFDLYGGKTLQLLQHDPYELSKNAGIDFSIADQLAHRVGVTRQDPRRVRAAIVSVLEYASHNEGHTALPRNELQARTRSKKLQIDASLAEQSIREMESEGLLIPDPTGTCLSLAAMSNAEQTIANKLLMLSEIPVERELKDAPDNLNEEQVEAVMAAQQHRCLVLTGSPGTGKTFTLRAILECGWENPVLAAPTGKAAKRLSELTGMPAFTLHRLLEYQPSSQSKTKMLVRGRQRALDNDLLIVDEASMLDVTLAAAMMRCIDPNRTTLLLCGDADQLPPVGPGNFLSDIIRSRKLPVIRLHQIMRQGAKSQIISNARAIMESEPLAVNNESFTDFKFLSIDASTQTVEEKEILKTLKELFTLLLQHGYSTQEIQVLSPKKKGPIPGAHALNTSLQEFLNPRRRGHPELKDHQVFRLGDRVIQLRNNYDLGVFNGDTGVVKEVDDNRLVVLFDEKTVEYERSQLSQLELAYAISVHKSQGSEWPVVVIPMSLTHRQMTSRRLLYTGMTRAKKLLILVGSEKSVAYAISEEPGDERITTLYHCLIQPENLVALTKHQSHISRKPRPKQTGLHEQPAEELAQERLQKVG